jgi:outer membrane biosynthesis protein TonB
VAPISRQGPALEAEPEPEAEASPEPEAEPEPEPEAEPEAEPEPELDPEPEPEPELEPDAAPEPGLHSYCSRRWWLLCLVWVRTSVLPSEPLAPVAASPQAQLVEAVVVPVYE